MTGDWDPEHKQKVRSYYSMFIGTICVFLGGALLLWDQRHPHPKTSVEIIVSGGIILLGLVAAMPHTFMPIVSNLIERIPGGPDNSNLLSIEETIQQALRERGDVDDETG